VDYRVGIF